jgi:hypothetical protein
MKYIRYQDQSGTKFILNPDCSTNKTDPENLLLPVKLNPFIIPYYQSIPEGKDFWIAIDQSFGNVNDLLKYLESINDSNASNELKSFIH